jgi:subtilase-type serine protease
VAYADWTQDALMLRAGAELGWGDNTISRQVPLVSETDYSRAAGHTAQAFADAGYRIDFGGGFMEPHAELVWIKADDGSFHETGGPLSALSGPSATDSVTYGTLGVRAALAEISLGTAVITPRADFGWQHAFNMSNPSQVVTFNATGDTDTILGVSPSVDTATAQIGFDVALSPNAKLSLGYDGILSEHEKDNAGTVQFQWRF